MACNYGRACGTLKARGRDVGAILIGEGSREPMCAGLDLVRVGRDGAIEARRWL